MKQFRLADVGGFVPETWMKSLFNRLTMGRNLAAMLLGVVGYGHFLVARRSGELFWWASLTGISLALAGLFMRRPWARGLALALLSGLFVMVLLEMKDYTVTRQRLIFASLAFFVGTCLWKWPEQGIIDLLTNSPSRTAKPSPAAESEPMISLVHLRRRPRYLEARVLAEALTDAWGLRIVAGDEAAADDAYGIVMGKSPLFFVMVNKPSFSMFMVHNRDCGYFDEADDVAAKVPNLRFAEIIRDHRAWLAVDLMQAGVSKVAEDEAYRMIGKAIAVLADDEVMAILCPQHNFFNLWSAKLEEMLCGESPLEALKEEIRAPVYGVTHGDVIDHAILEARRRWPEFVTIFKNRPAGEDRFIVKAPFMGEDGEVEHMWLQVFALEPDYVHGHLMNDPMHTTKLKKGAQVEVAVAEISDWICPDAENNPLGNFTHQAVTQAAKSKLSA